MIGEVLTEELVICNLEADNGIDVIEALLDRISSTGELHDPSKAREDVLANERRSSTGMQHGVAIPHAKTEAVSRLLAAVAVTKLPVDFDSLDGKPCRIFVMTLSPVDQVGPHMRFLAEIGGILRNRRVRSKILGAQTSAELLEAFRGAG